MLAKEIRAVLESPLTSQPAAYYLKRRNYYLGRWMSKGGMYPDPVIRLFQKGRPNFPSLLYTNSWRLRVRLSG